MIRKHSSFTTQLFAKMPFCYRFPPKNQRLKRNRKNQLSARFNRTAFFFAPQSLRLAAYDVLLLLGGARASRFHFYATLCAERVVAHFRAKVCAAAKPSSADRAAEPQRVSAAASGEPFKGFFAAGAAF